LTTVRQRYTFGTAGHIDHGKSSLVKALTGRDPDVRPEEKERGMTMDLGFCFAELDGEEVAIIDVPGHEDFLRTTVAGVSGIDYLLLIVDLSEGIMPQTREHLEVALAMGIDRGIVVLTKADMVDEETVLLVSDDIAEFLRGTPLEGSHMVATSVVTGQGLEELRRKMMELVAQGSTRRRDNRAVFRTPIDRVFTLPGFGTVVAGTVAAGSHRLGEELTIYPQGRKVRVRNMQVHGSKVQEVSPGQRAAFNLPGVEVESVERGDMLAVPGFFRPTNRLDLSINVSKYAAKPLRNRQRIRFMVNTSLSFGRVSLLDADQLQPGETGLAQIALEKPIVAVRQEPFVICDFSTLRVIGGGRVLFAYAVHHRRHKEKVIAQLQALQSADLAEFLLVIMNDDHIISGIAGLSELARLAQEADGCVEKALEELSAKGLVIAVAEDKYLTKERFEHLVKDAEKGIKEYLAKTPLSEGMPILAFRQKLGIDKETGDLLLARMTDEGRIAVAEGKVKLQGAGPTLSSAQRRMGQFISQVLKKESEKSGLAMASRAELEEATAEKDLPILADMLDYLTRSRELVLLFGNLYITGESLSGVKGKLIDYLKEHGSVRAADFKDLLKISRRQATAMLDYFSDQGITRRESGTHYLP
jgi:selenocysteine-specific elongation factor